jgi:Mg-chelatase subunit ChlD
MNTPRTYQELTQEELKGKDWIILVDTSGSMGEPISNTDSTKRIVKVREDALAISRLAEKYDDDGIAVITYGGHEAHVQNNVKADAVKEVFDKIDPRGGTPTHLALNEAFKLAKASSKESIIIAFTDGAATEEQQTIAAINNATRGGLKRPKVGLVFIQVAADEGATRFLKKLDESLTDDITAVISSEEAENLSAGQLAWAALNL